MPGTKQKLSSVEKKFLSGLKKEAKEKAKAKREVQKYSQELTDKNQAVQEATYRKVFLDANVDFDALKTKTDRMHKVQRRLVKKAFKKLRIENLAKIQKEVTQRKKIEKAYLKLFKKDMDAMIGNPVLKFLRAVDNDVRLIDEPSGLYGGGRTREFSSYSYSDAMRADYNDPRTSGALNWHAFYPEARVETGDYSDVIRLEFEQSITLYRPPLASGRGNFHVDRILVNLSGIGHAEARVGDECSLGFNPRGTRGMTTMDMDLHVQQTTPIPISGRVLNDISLWRGDGTHSEPIDIDLRLTSFPTSFLLASPDNGGAGVFVTIVLRTRVATYNKDGIAAINFSRDATDGLRLGCIQLHGEYLGG